jgi:hypothetical protein
VRSRPRLSPNPPSGTTRLGTPARPAIVDAVDYLFIALLAVALLVLVVVQAYSRHRRLSRREAAGQTTLPRSTWIVFSVAAAFFLFAVLIFPILLRK